MGGRGCRRRVALLPCLREDGGAAWLACLRRRGKKANAGGPELPHAAVQGGGDDERLAGIAPDGAASCRLAMAESTVGDVAGGLGAMGGDGVGVEGGAHVWLHLGGVTREP